MELRTTQRIRKYGNSYVVTIPKPYVDDGNLMEDHEYEILIRSKRTDLAQEPQMLRPGYHPGFRSRSGRHGLPIASGPIRRSLRAPGGRIHLTLDPATWDPLEEDFV